MSSTDSSRIAVALDQLADCEIEVEKAENDIELYRLRKLEPIFAKRDEILRRVPNFWKIVLSQHDDFANYVRASDFKFIDAIGSLIVHWNTPRDYHIIIHFNAIENELKEQTVKKHFIYQNEKLTSNPVDIDSQVAQGMGVKSFFDWFKWTGTECTKEFPNGADFAVLISEDIYPYCVKYYTEAQRDVEDEDGNSSSSEGELI